MQFHIVHHILCHLLLCIILCDAMWVDAAHPAVSRHRQLTWKGKISCLAAAPRMTEEIFRQTGKIRQNATEIFAQKCSKHEENQVDCGLGEVTWRGGKLARAGKCAQVMHTRVTRAA